MAALRADSSVPRARAKDVPYCVLINSAVVKSECIALLWGVYSVQFMIHMRVCACIGFYFSARIILRNKMRRPTARGRGPVILP